MIIGSLLFSIRIPVSKEWLLNLPALLTLLQLAGGIFIICGFGVFSSIIFWPEIDVRELTEKAETDPRAAAIALLGLKVFNGMALIAFAIWLALAVGGGLGPGVGNP